MNEEEIIEIINTFERDFKSYKDSGSALIKQLALNLIRADENEKESIIDFFLKEVSTNKNGYWSLCLAVIVEANQVTAAPHIERIYNLYNVSKDDNWKVDIIMAMLRLNYDKPHDLYKAVINYNIEKRTGRAFFLIIQYCRIAFYRGIVFLSDYYATNLLSRDSNEYNNKHHMGYLVHWLINCQEYCLPEIIKLTGKKSKTAGVLLKEALISYLDSIKSGDIKRELIVKCITEINLIDVGTS